MTLTIQFIAASLCHYRVIIVLHHQCHQYIDPGHDHSGHVHDHSDQSLDHHIMMMINPNMMLAI